MKAYETKKKLALSLAVAMVASSAPVLAFADTAIVAQAEAEMTVEEIIASVSAAINDPFLAAGLARIEAGEAAVATLPDGATKTALTETLQTARHMYDGLEQINQIWVALGAAGWQTNYGTEVAELEAIIAQLDAAFPGGSAFLDNFKTAVTETGLTYDAFVAMDVAAVNPTAANIAAAKEAVSKIMNPVAKANAQLRIETEIENQKLAVVSVSAINVTKGLGESYALPETVAVTLSNDSTVELGVVWDKVADTSAIGNYTFIGTLTMADGIVNNDNISVTANLSVVAPAKIELAKITNEVVGTVPFGTANTQVAVEAAMLTLANAKVDSAYTVTIAPGSTYSTVTKIWTGKFKVTNNVTATNTATDSAFRTITVATGVDSSGATTELAKVTDAVVGTVPFGTANTQAAVEAAMLTLANAKVDSAYKVTIAPGSTYNTLSKMWNGKFVVTSKSTPGNTATDATFRAITILTGVDVSGASTELAKITDAVVGTVPFGTANTQVAVEAAMLTLANAKVDSAYTVTIAPGSTYNTASKMWNGKFVVTNNTTATNTATDSAFRTITVATGVDSSGATTELAKVTDAVVGTVPFGTANTQAAVEAAMLTLANEAVDSAYTVTIAPGSTYSTVSKIWTGKFIVTNNSTAANTATDAAFRTIDILFN